MATSTSLSAYGLPLPHPITLAMLDNRLLMEEKNYDRQLLAKEYHAYLILHERQKFIFDLVMKSLEENTQVLSFVYGKALVVTAMTVTYYNSYQLESTTATTVEVNPDFPGLQSYLEKNAESFYVMQKSQQCMITEVSFTLTAQYLTALIRYYLNTVITDGTGSMEASFFNDSLTHLVGYSCNQMMIEKKNMNPKEIPPVIKSLTGIQLLLTVNIKPNGSLGVDSAQKTSTITPATPDSKTNTSRRNQAKSKGTSRTTTNSDAANTETNAGTGNNKKQKNA
ncbi:hypothetical protein QVD17_20440 [Tagetes erecta]|uniref:RecQ-mediated genome instability protein 1 C-terminal OB-fold domain-containing protein n=1 Tax=Tagetes erecta TaxID=13708 RepID=A0AAD8KPX8_TARER|nr:hypothetical protein QVD17_20440 [Tagetes erecta]